MVSSGNAQYHLIRCQHVAREGSMAHKNLTDRTIKALKPAPKGKVNDNWDRGFPGFGVRVSDTGRRTFVLAARYPGSPNPTRRALGLYGPLTLKEASEKASRWLEMIERGIDPRDEEERQRLTEQKRRLNTFAAVAEDFIAEKLPQERGAKQVELDLRRIFIPAWGGRPITEISDLDVLGIIKARRKSAPVRARNLLALLKRFFAWAIDQIVYEIKSSPCDRLKPKSLFGEREPRQNTLSDADLFAFWRAIDRMPYPHGPVYKLLLLTGLRLNEAADARWSEFDPAVIKALRHRKDGAAIDWNAIDKKRLRWIIPGARMKGKNSKARPHAVPLVPDLLKVLENLPQIGVGDFVFSTSGGERAVWMSSKIKQKLDRRMLSILRAGARMNGEDPRKEHLKHWTNHDLRRVVRSGLSRLRVPENVAEGVLAHAKPGLVGTYNVDDLFEQKAEALAEWATYLKSVTSPSPTNNVVRFGRERETARGQGRKL
jgi:integrase